MGGRGTVPGDRGRDDPARLLAESSPGRPEADVVVAYLHWGSRARAALAPTNGRIAARLVEAGADVVVGTHAHQLQGDGRLGRGYVAYGLGNFAWYAPGTVPTPTGVLTLTVRPPVDRRGAPESSAPLVARRVIGPTVWRGPSPQAGRIGSRAAGQDPGLRGLEPRGPIGPMRPGASQPARSGRPARAARAGRRPGRPPGSGSPRTASSRAGPPADRRGRTTSVVAAALVGVRHDRHPQRPGRREQAALNGIGGCGRPHGHHVAHPDPVQGDHAPHGPSLARKQVLDVGPRPVVVVGVASVPGLLGAERHEDDGEPGPVARDRLCRGEHDSDARRVVLGSWCRRHGVEVGADQVRLLRREAGRPR